MPEITINTPLTLPCGAEIPNRIAKSAMSENMASAGHKPGDRIMRLYKAWSQSGAGILFTGNVMIDPAAIGEPHNIVVEDERHMEALRRWAGIAKSGGSKIWMQINHPGRQAPSTFNKEVVAPSAVGIKGKMIFKTPRPLSDPEILQIIERFGNTAVVAKKAGFDGVQIHGAHGYLVSQFLSPLTNLRTDKWGGSLEARARFVLKVYENIRLKTGPDFPVGIKINSADFMRGGFSEEESMEVIDLLSTRGIDLIEISGGTYERSAMMGSEKASTRQREAYFMDYIVKARQRTTIPLMLTGGFRSREAMNEALAGGEVDIIGMARPFALFPELARQLIREEVASTQMPVIKTGLQMIDKLGFLDVVWYSAQLDRIGRGKLPKPDLSPWVAVRKVVRDAVL